MHPYKFRLLCVASRWTIINTVYISDARNHTHKKTAES